MAESSYQKDGRTIYGVDIVAEVFDLLAPPAAQTEERVHAIVSTLRGRIECDRLGLASPASCPPPSI